MAPSVKFRPIFHFLTDKLTALRADVGYIRENVIVYAAARRHAEVDIQNLSRSSRYHYYSFVSATERSAVAV